MQIDLKYYYSLLIARLHYVLLIAAAVAAGVATLAVKLPPVYEASATLLLEAPQIPTSLAAPTVNTAALEQFQVLEQRLMTRPNLLDIARKLNVFPGLNKMTPDDIVTAMTKATTIDIHTGQNQAALMTISFDAGQAKTTADVVNEYVTRILADSIAMRTDQAQSTLQFFKQEVDQLQGELSAQSAKIVAFQNAHTNALPSTLDSRLQQQSTLQLQLNTITSDIASLQDQRQRLIDMFNATGQIAGSAAASSQTPEQLELAQARSALAAGQAVYSAENPKLKMLQDRVTELAAVVKAQAATAAPQKQPASTSSTLLDVQTADIDARIRQLKAQEADTRKALAALQATIDQTPQVAAELGALQSDYDNIQKQYNAASDRLGAASTGQRIETLAKGQKVVVLDAAAVPDTPTRPHRLRLAIYGVLGGLALGIGFVLLLELLNTSVRRPVDLVRGLDITPIVAIPYMQTPGEIRRKQLTVLAILLILVTGLPASLYAIDRYYAPLSVVLAKINTKLGL